MKLTNYYPVLLLLVFLFTTACSGLIPAPTPSPTAPSATETTTATIVWFPPTQTSTPFSTEPVLPTPDQRPGLGEMLFSDVFDQPGLWNTSSSPQSSATINRSRLILSISGQGPISITSLRNQPVIGDFFAEATVRLSLCIGSDQFGMVFRATPGGDYYRLTVNCEGQSRLERIASGSNSPLVDWLSSGDAPTAAPAEVVLGVWAVGNELRIFLNNNLQFSVRDPVLQAGTLGFFVYADGAFPITASFSNLSVYSVSYVSPTPSLIPSHTPTP